MDKKIRRNRIRRARKVRRMKKMLTSGVLLLAALLFLSLVFVPKVSAERELKARSAREAELEAKMTKVTIGAIGTCIFGDERGTGIKGSFLETYEKKENPAYFFQNVKTELEKADVNVTNFIGDMSEETAAGRKHPIKGQKEYAEILKEGSIDLVNLANDRTKDYGQDGYYDTAIALNEAGVGAFGHDRVSFKNINGIQIGFIGIDVLDRSMDMQALLVKNIRLAEGAGAHMIVVCMNWGKEGAQKPGKSQEEWAHRAVEAGADLVLGYHPSHVQQVERYEGSYIIYSLGVFCNGAEKNPEVWDGVIYRQTFGFLDGKLAKAWEPEQIPCRISSDSGENNFQPELDV